MHPLTEDLSKLKDGQLEEKIRDLNKKYWLTDNSDVKHQISLFLEMYNQELQARRARLWLQQTKTDNGLDNLINIS